MTDILGRDQPERGQKPRTTAGVLPAFPIHAVSSVLSSTSWEPTNLALFWGTSAWWTLFLAYFVPRLGCHTFLSYAWKLSNSTLSLPTNQGKWEQQLSKPVRYQSRRSFFFSPPCAPSYFPLLEQALSSKATIFLQVHGVINFLCCFLSINLSLPPRFFFFLQMLGYLLFVAPSRKRHRLAGGHLNNKDNWYGSVFSFECCLGRYGTAGESLIDWFIHPVTCRKLQRTKAHIKK